MNVRICGISRLQGLVKGALLAGGGVMLFIPAFYVWPTLRFVPSPTSNRITDYAMAITVGVMALVGVMLAGAGLRWALFVVWPARMGIEADDQALYLRLGPFGNQRLEWARLETIYAFDLDDPSEADPDRLVLEPEAEMEKFLPRMRHPAVEGDVNRMLERFAAVDEPTLAAKLRRYIEKVRGD